MDCTQQSACKKPDALKVVNIGLQSFYDALAAQEVQAVQLDWTPPVELKQEIADLLDDLL